MCQPDNTGAELAFRIEHQFTIAGGRGIECETHAVWFELDAGRWRTEDLAVSLKTFKCLMNMTKNHAFDLWVAGAEVQQRSAIFHADRIQPGAVDRNGMVVEENQRGDPAV